MQCPACNHSGSTTDFGQPPRCPECDAFYEKALIARAKRNEIAANLEAKREQAASHQANTGRPRLRGKVQYFLGKEGGRNIVFAAGISFVALVCIGLWMKPRTEVITNTPQAAPPSFVAPIAPGALTTYVLEQYPKTYAIWGDSGVARISDIERRAAELVAKSGLCDRVEMVGLSEAYSRPPKSIVVYVDCANRKRSYVGSSELSGEHKLVFKKI